MALLAQGRDGRAGRPRRCGVLAYGDLKRVELAIALAAGPRLLLMDEPTAGMAPAERDRLMRWRAALAREAGIAVLFTEHDMDMVFGLADRILVLDRGEVIAEGNAAESAPIRGCARSISAPAASSGAAHARRCRASTRATAARTSSTASPVGVAPARWWRCSAATARASPPR